MSSHTLAARFHSKRPGDSLKTDELESLLQRIFATTRATWPSLHFDEHELSEFLASEYSGSQLQALSEARIGDMLMAHLCGKGNPGALALFDQEYLARIPAMLAHMKLGSAAIDEIKQIVRMKLLVAASGEEPKIAGYASRGKLDGLVQVVATRAAISLQRRVKPTSDQEELVAIPGPTYDLGLHCLKESYHEAFGECFEQAVSALSRRDRNLMRLHLLDKLPLEQLASMYLVHRATVVRWLAKAREQLFDDTQERLSQRLQIDATEFASLMKLIASRLDVSVERMLQTMGDRSE